MKLSDIQPYLTECRDVLRPTDAEYVERRENVNASLLKEREVTRSWKNLAPDRIPIYKAFLDFYTDASNQQPRFYVDDPLVGGESMANGRWRNAFVFESYQGDVPTLNQTLRYGFIEQLVKGEVVDYSEARLVNTEWYNGDGGENDKEDYKTIQWKGVSPVKSHEIVESLKALSPESWSPVVNGNNLGEHHRLHVRAVEDQDGSHTIQLILANPRSSYVSYEGRRNWFKTIGGVVKYHFNVPKDLVPTILAAEQVGGATATVSQPDEKGLCNVVVRQRDIEDDQKETMVNELSGLNCRQNTYVDVYWGLSDAEASAISLPPDATVGTTHTMDKRANGDGTWDVQVRRVVAQKQKVQVPEYKPDIDTKQKDDTVINLMPNELIGFLQGNEPGTHGIDYTTSNPEDLRGVQRRITVELNPDCTMNVTGRSNEPDAAGDDLDPPIGESKTVLHDLALYWNQTKQQVLAILSDLAAQEDNITKEVDIRRNNLGQFDLRVSTRTHDEHEVQILSAPSTGSKGIKSHFRAGINKLEGVYPLTIESGPRARVSVSAQPDPKGGMSWTANREEVEEVTEKNLEAESPEHGQHISESTFLNVDEGNLPTIDKQEKGETVIPSITANPDGTFSGGVRRVKQHKNDDITNDKSGASLRKVTTTSVLSDDDFAPNTAQPTDGKVLTFRGTPNQDGSVTWVRVEEEFVAGDAKAEGGEDVGGIELKVTIETFRNQTQAQLDAQGGVPETSLKSVSFANVTLNDTGLIDFVKITQEVTIDGSLTSAGHVIVDEDIWQYRDQPIRTRIAGYWSTQVQFIGRRQKRRITRTITRKFYTARTNASASEDQRSRAGEISIGPFTVYYVDTEDLHVNQWEADGADQGLYHYALSLPVMSGPP